MDYVHSAFYEATGWSRDNSYASLNATSDGMFAHPGVNASNARNW